jgi:hypothetical protein
LVTLITHCMDVIRVFEEEELEPEERLDDQNAYGDEEIDSDSDSDSDSDKSDSDDEEEQDEDEDEDEEDDALVCK